MIDLKIQTQLKFQIQQINCQYVDQLRVKPQIIPIK